MHTKHEGYRGKKEEGGERERKGKDIQAKSLFLMLYSTSRTSAQRDTKGHREKYLLGEKLLPAKELLCYTSVYYHNRTGREEKETTRSARE